MGLTDAYFTLGKCPLIRKSDRERFPNLEAIDRSGVKIGVNPGGTNEAFVREHIQNATIIVIEDNLAIPSAVASAEVDVMLTDNVEAVLASRDDERLLAVSPDEPLTNDELAYMLPRGDPAFRNWLDLWIHRMKLTGDLDRIRPEVARGFIAREWSRARPGSSAAAAPPRPDSDARLRRERNTRVL